jgi:hypothetical protein
MILKKEMNHKTILKFNTWLKRKSLIASVFDKAKEYRRLNGYSQDGLDEMEIQAQNWKEQELKNIEEEFDKCIAMYMDSKYKKIK